MYLKMQVGVIPIAPASFAAERWAPKNDIACLVLAEPDLAPQEKMLTPPAIALLVQRPPSLVGIGFLEQSQLAPIGLRERRHTQS